MPNLTPPLKAGFFMAICRRENMPVWQRWWFIALLALALGAAVWLYFRWRERSIQRSQALQQALVEARYEALRSQVNPHFLFNSFNTLMALIETDPSRATGYLAGLSRFFRGILQRREQAVATLGEELQLLNEYVALQQTRFEQAVVFDNRVEERWLNHRLPPLALQQLAENALKHNAFSVQQPLVIALSVQEGILRMENTFKPLQAGEVSGTGFGLQSLRRQLEALVHQTLVVGHNERYFWVEIPLLSPDEAHSNH
jgi:LytS/YehU family sensor histidine kinase